MGRPAHFVACYKFPGDCCPSCHDDEDEGYETLYAEDVEVAPGVWVGVSYCCRKAEIVRDRVQKMVKRLGGTGRAR
jgi:hypothetical protein